MSFPTVFPSAFQSMGDALIQSLHASGGHLSPDGFSVVVDGEPLSLPYRLYCDPDRFQFGASAPGSDEQRLTLCMGTRHNDGYVREHCVRRLGAIDRPWMIPFFVRLLGEYVVEIVNAVADCIPSADPAQVAAFVADNPSFMATTRRRAISYWDCYYRAQWATLASYPGVIALDRLESLSASSR